MVSRKVAPCKDCKCFSEECFSPAAGRQEEPQMKNGYRIRSIN
jgi:hypothetical protein